MSPRAADRGRSRKIRSALGRVLALRRAPRRSALRLKRRSRGKNAATRSKIPTHHRETFFRSRRPARELSNPPPWCTSRKPPRSSAAKALENRCRDRSPTLPRQPNMAAEFCPAAIWAGEADPFRAFLLFAPSQRARCVGARRNNRVLEARPKSPRSSILPSPPVPARQLAFRVRLKRRMPANASPTLPTVGRCVKSAPGQCAMSACSPGRRTASSIRSPVTFGRKPTGTRQTTSAPPRKPVAPFPRRESGRVKSFDDGRGSRFSPSLLGAHASNHRLTAPGKRVEPRMRRLGAGPDLTRAGMPGPFSRPGLSWFCDESKSSFVFLPAPRSRTRGRSGSYFLLRRSPRTASDHELFVLATFRIMKKPAYLDGDYERANWDYLGVSGLRREPWRDAAELTPKWAGPSVCADANSNGSTRAPERMGRATYGWANDGVEATIREPRSLRSSRSRGARILGPPRTRQYLAQRLSRVRARASKVRFAYGTLHMRRQL